MSHKQKYKQSGSIIHDSHFSVDWQPSVHLKSANIILFSSCFSQCNHLYIIISLFHDAATYLSSTFSVQNIGRYTVILPYFEQS